MRTIVRSVGALGALALLAAPAMAAAPPPPAGKEQVLVVVHGAFAGGWQARKLVPLLEPQGIRVLRPSLPGMGEHFHIGSPGIGLATHIDDIVHYILFEDLHDITLLGHSYGGMVITGVAHRLPERIRKLIYLDAFVPEDGESWTAINGQPPEGVYGLIQPRWVKPGQPPPHDVPHPVKALTEVLQLKNPAALKLPATYILTYDPGKKPEDDRFFRHAERARSRGWLVENLEGDHVPQWNLPEQTAALIVKHMARP